MTTEQKNLMARIDEIAAKHDIEVSTYPGPNDSCTISTYDDSELPDEFVESLEEDGITASYGYGNWPSLYSRE